MLELAPKENCIYFDLGSGFGSFCRLLAKKRPDVAIYGIENSLFPFVISRLIQWVWRYPNLKLYRRDFLKMDLRALANVPEVSYTEIYEGRKEKAPRCIYFTYLCVRGMKALKEPLKRQLKKGDLLISNYFKMHGWKPLERPYRRDIYVYDSNSYFETFLESQSMMSLDSYMADPSTTKHGT